ncbi:MAG: flagellar motor switch protein FliG, partial [Methylococcales bacterium]|nr:flagellar motor switch protein FliG [Methylococcales bacterium]
MDDKEAKLSSVQKAALLLLAVGQERAGNVLKNLEPKDVQQVGEAMAKLGAVSTSMVDGVLEQFIVNVKRQTGFSLNSDSYIRNMLVSALGEEKANSVIDKILMDGKSKGIAQLRWMDTRSIADMIRLEHPQIIATILSLMDPEQAA